MGTRSSVMEWKEISGRPLEEREGRFWYRKECISLFCGF